MRPPKSPVLRVLLVDLAAMVLMVGWAVIDRALDELGRKPQN